ncbi:hypothetical protein O6H91_17G078500 [Diphasiastrum complanatum]|uniref:Uncharacterized protein n=1 Tax=Diphasiastrum complanatum TaxID=34168 RepID=A0ACC2B8I8_DIPCM|nr:hypothetical protein O6H91_17G078500 [Diphasiastrum complanatum]
MEAMAGYASYPRACAWLLTSCVMIVLFSVVDAKTVLDPTGMVNLNKNQAYTNSLLCLQNTTVPCPGANLGESGNVQPNNTAAFCTQGCLNQTMVMLKCIDHVYNDFRFNNKGTTNDIRAALNKGCSHNSIFYGNFTVIPSPSGAFANAIPNVLFTTFVFTSIIYTTMKL